MSNQGWECPRCGSVNAPAKQECTCSKQNKAADQRPVSESSCCICNPRAGGNGRCKFHRIDESLEKICD
jgi:hypothetical protein